MTQQDSLCLPSHDEGATPYHIHPTPEDADTEALLDAAMGAARLTRTAERLREGNSEIKPLAYCAHSIDNRLIGTVSFWPLRIGTEQGLLLGPLAVHPDYRDLKIGFALMQTALKTLEAHCLPGGLPVLLVGDLPYYERVGFMRAPVALTMPGPVDSARLLVRGASPHLNGKVQAAPQYAQSISEAISRKRPAL